MISLGSFYHDPAVVRKRSASTVIRCLRGWSVTIGDMERPQRDFKGIWIPREIWLSDQLSLMEKVLFVEIHSLDNERGCFASNKYFADFFSMSERQIRTHIGSLKE